VLQTLHQLTNTSVRGNHALLILIAEAVMAVAVQALSTAMPTRFGRLSGTVLFLLPEQGPREYQLPSRLLFLTEKRMRRTSHLFLV